MLNKLKFYQAVECIRRIESLLVRSLKFLVMKTSCFFFLLIFPGNLLFAQTWTGNTNTNWNTASNWSTGTVPLPAANVVIPGALTNYPVFYTPVIINSIQMEPGSRLDVNGYSLTLNGIAAGTNFTGATLNNSNAATDIEITLNTGIAGFVSYFRSNLVNDNIVFYLGGGNSFLEGDIAPANQYNGNVSFNIAGTLNVFISQTATSVFNGSLVINRTIAGSTSAFAAGATIGGNFSYLNATSGNTILGGSSATNITGSIQVAANYAIPAVFEMHRISNQTSGGNINVQNSTGFFLENNSLKVGSLTITGYKTGQQAYLTNNTITGNVAIADDASFSGGYNSSIANNTITGNTAFSINGSNSFYDAPNFNNANKYFGNVTYTAAGSGSLYIAYLDSLHCSGNVSINRTASGLTNGFFKGGSVEGNFSYTNSTTGDSYFGGGIPTNITGTMQIAVNYSSPAAFQLSNFTNKTAGGNINIQNSTGFDVENNLLKLNTLSITGYKIGQQGFLSSNDITGNVTIADDAGFGGGYNTYISKNKITGNTAFTINGNTTFYERGAGNTSNSYTGNLSVTRNAGTVLMGETGFAEISQDLTLNSNAGIVLGNIKFTGSTNSLLEQLSVQPIEISMLTMEKNSGGKLILNDAITITHAANLTGGNIYSSTSNPIGFANGSTSQGASDISYIDGPVIKTGATYFTFPVGRSGKIAPISIAPNGVVTDAFRAEYFMSAPGSSGYNASLKDPGLDHISFREFWTLNRVAGSAAAPVSLSWDTARSGTVNNLPDLRVARWNGSMWKDEGQGFIDGNNIAGVIFTAAAVTDFSPFTLASASSLNPLPVTLLSFTATKSTRQVNLQWVAANELNLLHYEVERSVDAVHYAALSTMPAVGGLSQTTYRAYDNGPAYGINYYRLKITDIGGRFTYSGIATVNFNTKITFSIWPNPATDYFVVTNAGNFTQIQIIDVSGKLVRQMNRSNDNRYSTYGLGKGLYVVQLVGTDKVTSAKLLIE